MYRIIGRFRPPANESIETIAQRAGVPVQYAKARCQHGYTTEQTCIQCENGYIDDLHIFARLRSQPIFAALTDDATEVAYISRRHHAKLVKAGY